MKDTRVVILVNIDGQVCFKDGTTYYKFIYSDYHTNGLQIDGIIPNITIEFTSKEIKEIRDINSRKYVGVTPVTMVILDRENTLKQFDILLEQHEEKFKKIEDKDLKWDIIEFIDKHRTLFNYLDNLIY
jgi:hypothetical protein